MNRGSWKPQGLAGTHFGFCERAKRRQSQLCSGFVRLQRQNLGTEMEKPGKNEVSGLSRGLVWQGADG